MLVAPSDAPAEVHPVEAADIRDLVAGAEQVVLAGPARPVGAAGSASTVFRPKDILLDLVQARLGAGGKDEGGGPDIRVANSHFLPISDWSDRLAVVHFSALEQTCPVPLARNIQVLDGEDLLGLGEERRLSDRNGLRHQRVGLMDHVLSLVPVPPGLVGRAASPLALPPLLAHAGQLRRDGIRPVQWCACDIETGPYNFLHLRRQPTLRTTHVRVLLDGAAAARDKGRGAPTLVAFATPQGLGELGPVLRAFAALPGSREAAGPRLQVFFFGAPEELVGALAERSWASFFGDNFHCPGIRFLFAPFAAADLLDTVANAAGTVDSCHGGVLDALARALRVRARLVLGSDGGFDAWQDGQATAQFIAWDTIHAAATLAGRQHKAGRGQERRLLGVMATMLEGA